MMNNQANSSIYPVDEVKGKLNRLLLYPPEYGEISITAIFRGGHLVRVETQKKESEQFAISSSREEKGDI